MSARHDGRNGTGRGIDGADASSGEKMKIPRDPLRIIVALLIFLAIGRAHQHYGFIGALQPALLLFAGGAAYAFFNARSIRWTNVTTSWPPKVVAALALLACFSIPFGISIGSAGNFMINSFSKVVLTFFLVVVAVRRTGDLKMFVWAFVLGCGFLVYISLFSFTLQSTGSMMRLSNLYFYDANDLTVVLTTGIPLSLVLFQNTGRAGRIVSGIILLGIGMSLARSGSRGGFLGLLAVGIVLLFLVRNVSIPKRAGAVLVLAAGLFIMAPEGYWSQMETLTEPTEDYNWQSPYGRKAVAERGMGYMLQYPLFGVGVGNFGRAEGVLSQVALDRASTGSPYRWSAAHNSFVQAGAELGVPGLILFCTLVFGGMFGLARLRKRLPGSWQRGGAERRFLYDLATYLPVSLVGFAVAGFFVSFAYHDLLYVLTVFVTGVYVCVRRELLKEHREKTAGAAGGPGRGLGEPRSGRRARVS